MSEPFRFKWWNTEQGLPHSWVECIAQTPDGYLWIGTHGGLVRFDGVRFTVFNDLFGPNTGPVFPKQFAVDSKGTLWIATKRGLLRRDASSFRAFTSRDGLCADQVSSVCPSKRGGVWVAAAQGVNHITENKVECYSTAGLVKPFVYSVCEDRQEILWAGTLHGLLRLDPATHSFTRIWEVEAETYPPEDERRIVRSLFADLSSRLWFSTDETLFLLRNGQAERVPGGEAPAGDRLRPMFEDQEGNVWLVKRNGLFRYDGVRMVRCDPADLAADAQFNCLFQDREDNYWLGTAHGGFCRMQPSVLQTYTTRNGLCHNEVWSVCAAKEGGVWIGTAAGVGLFRNEQFTKLLIDCAYDPNLGDSSYHSVVEDRDGDLWLGATFRGYSQLHRTNRHYSFVEKMQSSAPIRAMFQDSAGAVWIGRNGALDISFPRPSAFFSGTLKRMSYDTHSEYWLFSSGGFMRFTMGAPFVWRRGCDQWQRLGPADESRVFSWADVCAVDTEGWTQRLPQNEISNYDVRAILQDHSGAMWFGTDNGLNRLQARRFSVLTTKDGLISDSILALYEDADGILWVGTSSGLSRITFAENRSNRREEALTSKPALRTPHSALECFSFTIRQGLFDNQVRAIVEDDFGCLWLTCGRGISRVRREDLNRVANGRAPAVRSISFGEADGMLSGETADGCQPSACKTRDGKLWFATARGVVVLDPARVKENNLPPAVHIEEVRSNAERVFQNFTGAGVRRVTSDSAPHNPQSAIKGSALRTPNSALSLRAGSGTHLEFDYTAASFSAPEKVQFKYRLEGLEKEWVNAGTRRTAYYANLRPGQYCFRVIACNNHNVWNETGAALAFAIQPFTYETWWFRLAVVLTFLLLVLAIVLARTRHLRQVHALERQAALAHERARIARDMHDHLGASLAHIALLNEQRSAPGSTGSQPVPSGEPLEGIPKGQAASEILPINPDRESISDLSSPNDTGKSPPLPASVSRHDEIANKVHETLRDLNELIWAVNPKNDTLEHFADFLAAYAGKFLVKTGIQLRLEIPATLPVQTLSADVRHHLMSIIKEALCNAVRHGRPTEIHLGLTCSPDTLEILIADDGDGFDVQEPRSGGSGLNNLRDRAALLGAKLDIDSKPGNGTSVRLTVKLGKAT